MMILFATSAFIVFQFLLLPTATYLNRQQGENGRRTDFITESLLRICDHRLELATSGLNSSSVNVSRTILSYQ